MSIEASAPSVPGSLPRMALHPSVTVDAASAKPENKQAKILLRVMGGLSSGLRACVGCEASVARSHGKARRARQNLPRIVIPVVPLPKSGAASIRRVAVVVLVVVAVEDDGAVK